MVTDVLYSSFRNRETIKLVEFCFIGSSTIGWSSENQRLINQEYETKPINENIEGEK